MLNKYLLFIKEYFRTKKMLIILLQLSLLIMAMMNMFLASLTQKIIDNVFINKNNLIFYYIFQMVVVIGACYLFGIIGNYLNLKLLNKVDYKIKEDFFDKLQHSSYEFLQKIDASEIYYRMFGDINVLVNYAIKIFVTLPVQICYILCILLKMKNWSIILTTYAMILILIQILNLICFKKPINKVIELKKNIEQNIIYKVNEHFRKIEVTKVFGIEKNKMKEFSSEFNNVVHVNIKNSFIVTLFQSFTGIMNQLWYLGLLILSSHLIFSDKMTVGTFTGFYMLTNSLYSPTISMVETLMDYQECKISFQRFLEYYNNYDKLMYEGKKQLQKISKIHLLNICFNYNNKIIYKDASLKIDAGTMVLLTGESGIGKTTLFKMMARLIKPINGIIKINNIDINEITHDSYFNEIGFLIQEPIIFDDTIYNNIILDSTNISEEDVKKALKAVNLWNRVQLLKDRMNTLIGTGGISLSVGESQRLCLARLIATKKSLLVLDEPTASLDNYNRNEIYRIIDNYKKEFKATILIISHDNTAKNYADTIVTIKNNKFKIIKKENTIN